jgi:hypothetical protein
MNFIDLSPASEAKTSIHLLVSVVSVRGCAFATGIGVLGCAFLGSFILFVFL